MKHKPGQGRVARLLTAAGIAVIMLGATLWIESEVESFYSGMRNVPTVFGETATAYKQRALNPETNRTAPNRTLKLSPEAAQSVSEHFGPNLGRAGIRIISSDGERTVTNSVVAIDEAAGELTLETSLRDDFPAGSQVESVLGTNYMIWIKAGILIGAVVVIWLFIVWVLNRPKIVDFLIATEAEMRKVNWPSRREVIGSTWVVVIGTFMLAIMLWVTDLMFAQLFMLIDILER